MKIHSLKKCLLITFTLSLLASSAQGGKYAGVFSRDIYDQTDIYDQHTALSKTFKDKDEKGKNEELIKLLKDKKTQELESHCIKKIESKILFLKEEYNSATKKDFWEECLSTVDHIINGVAIIAAFNKEDTHENPFGRVVGSIIGKISALLGKEELKKHFSEQQAATIANKILDLEIEIKGLYADLENEPIKEIETKYIIQKRQMESNKSLIMEIEKGLLETRESNYTIPMTTQFLDLALHIPLQPKPLVDTSDINKSRCELRKKFDSDPLFKNYDDNIREEMASIITSTAINSVTLDNSTTSNRDICYFWGEPSSGKSTAARRIPSFLGLPCFEMTARAASDFSQMNVEGTDRIMQNPKPGWLAEALMGTTEYEKISYKNAFLIINDLDRVIKNSTEPVTFLLDYLEPQKKYFYNFLFRANIDISRLNIIITANTQLKHDAIGTRVPRKIEFPRLSDAVTKKIMDDKLKALRIKHRIPNIISFEYENPTNIVGRYDRMIAKSYEVTEVLSLISQLFSELSERSGQEFNYKTNVGAEREAGRNDRMIAQSYEVTGVLPLFSQLYSGISERIWQKFNYKTNVISERKKTITLRELESTLEINVNDIANRLANKGDEWLEAAENPDISEKEKLKLYKQAAVVGNMQACLKLGNHFKYTSPDIANQWYKQAKDSSQKAKAQYDDFIRAQYDVLIGELRNISPKQQRIEKLLSFLPRSIKLKTEGEMGFRTPFHIAAAMDDNTALLDALLKNQDQSTVETLLIEPDSNGNTPFHVAAREGKEKSLQALLKKCPDGKNHVGRDNYTPIMQAVAQGHLPIVTLLHKAEADMTIKDKDGCTVLQKALMMRNQNPQKYTDIFEFLLEKNGPVKDSTGKSVNDLTPKRTEVSSHAKYKITNPEASRWKRALSATSNVAAVSDVSTQSIFRFIPSSTPGYYFIENVENRKIISVDGTEIGSTVSVKGYDNIGEDQRLFQFISKGNDCYRIINKENKGALYRWTWTGLYDSPIKVASNDDDNDNQKLFRIKPVTQ